MTGLVRKAVGVALLLAGAFAAVLGFLWFKLDPNPLLALASIAVVLAFFQWGRLALTRPEKFEAGLNALGVQASQRAEGKFRRGIYFYFAASLVVVFAGLVGRSDSIPLAIILALPLLVAGLVEHVRWFVQNRDQR